jgi:ATP-dependent protease ClpP protease subunit
MDWSEPISKNRKIKEEDDDDNNQCIDEDEDTIYGKNGINSSQYIRSNGSDIYFYAGIDKKNILNLQKETQKVVDNITSKAIAAEKIGCIVTYPPIKLHINSLGGYIHPAFAFIDFMTQVKLRNPKVVFHTIIEGGSASAATLISVTGDRRFITEYGYMLIHQLAGVHWGKYVELKDDMKNSAELMNRIKKIYTKHSKLTDKELNKILKHDLYWDADKCLDVGLVDEILK